LYSIIIRQQTTTNVYNCNNVKYFKELCARLAYSSTPSQIPDKKQLAS
jgi:hypothetical protein